MRFSVLACLLLPVLLGVSAQEEPEWRREVLDPRYTVEWRSDFETKQLEFLIRAKTTGFVGFGLSVGGTMNGADIVIGGVHPDGTKYFSVSKTNQVALQPCSII